MHVQPISKPLSVVLAECGHFVVTWSVQEYSCGHLVCAGIFLHSPVHLVGHAMNMLFLMKLLFGFCLDFLLPNFLDNTGE